MTTPIHAQARDAEFALCVEQIAEAIRLPEKSLSPTFREIVVGTATTACEAFSTPDAGTIRQALKGFSI